MHITCNIAKKGIIGMRSSSPASSFVPVDSDILRNPFQAILPPLAASNSATSTEITNTNRQAMNEKKTISLTLKLDELNRDRAQHFLSIYDFETIIGDSDKKFSLGVKDPRICRFCKKTDKEVTFKTDAHVMPQFMGNRNLLSYFECDECNSLFSLYEDSFANFFGISRTFAQIKRQSRKVPKYKDNKTGLEVFLTDTGIQMTMIEGNDPIKFDLENKSLEITTERPTYIPIHIPKTLIINYQYQSQLLKSAGLNPLYILPC